MAKPPTHGKDPTVFQGPDKGPTHHKGMKPHDHGPGHNGPGRDVLRRPSGPDRLVGALRRLNHLGELATIGMAIQVAEKLEPDGRAAEILRSAADDLDAAGDIDLAIDRLSIELMRRRRAARRRLLDREGLFLMILPLPPDIVLDFKDAGGRAVISPDDHPPPPGAPLDLSSDDPFSRRNLVKSATTIVFDAMADVDGLWMRRSVIDLVDNDILKPDAAIGVHLRPHRFPEDGPAPAALVERMTRI